MPVVMIVDQRKSRRDVDRIPDLVASLNELATDSLIMPFQRTLGDECEGVLHSLDRVPALVSAMARQSCWWIGIGLGDISGVAADSRDVSGEAFGIAREMVEAAKRRTRRESGKSRSPWPLRVGGFGGDRDQAIEACLATIHMISASRSKREGQVAAMLDSGFTDQTDIARELSISQPAVSKAIARAHWDEEKALERCVHFLGRDAA